MNNLKELSTNDINNISGGTENPIGYALGYAAGTFYGYMCLGLEAYADFFLDN